jgi:hypothetical protein
MMANNSSNFDSNTFDDNSSVNSFDSNSTSNDQLGGSIPDADYMLFKLTEWLEATYPYKVLPIVIGQKEVDQAIKDATDCCNYEDSDYPSFAINDLINYSKYGTVLRQRDIIRSLIKLPNYVNLNTNKYIKHKKTVKGYGAKKHIKSRRTRKYINKSLKNNKKIVKLSHEYHVNMIYMKNLYYRGGGCDDYDLDSYDCDDSYGSRY